MRTPLVLSFLAFVVIAACSSSPQGTSTAAGGAGGGTGGGDSGGNGGDAGCASQILCGAGVCCPAGDECFQGACVAACDSGSHCGNSCCKSGELCSSGACVVPGGPCADSVDCGPNEYCEVVLGKCLPQTNDGGACQAKKPPAPFEPVLLWSLTAPVAQPDYFEAVSAPLVVDADKDGTPDVFVTTGDVNIDDGVNAGFLRRLDGKTGAEKWDETTDALQPDNMVNVTFSPALADLDGDGKVEIVTMAASTWDLIAFEATGKLKWRSHKKDGSSYVFPDFYASTVAIADMDHDGQGEVVIGGVIFDSKGTLVSGDGRQNEGSGSGAYGSSSSIIADVDGDGKQEVIVGNAVYRKDGSTVWSNAADPDGYPAIADLDLDGKPEIVVTTTTSLRVLRAATGELLHETPLVAVNPSGAPGSPAIADVDGDGKPDIALQFTDDACSIRAYGYDKAAGLTQKWAAPLHICSGFLTPTAFDFDGDGSTEVLAHDDCRITVLRGKDGTVELTLPASHATWTEFVSVADVDGDHSADLLFSSNESWKGVNHTNDYYNPKCGYAGDEAASHGLFVYHDPMGRWMPTRRVWNQQAYHITNIRSDGSLPEPEIDNWSPGSYNDYRVSAQGKGATNAPDLALSLSASLADCPDKLSLVAQVVNQGSAGVKAGISVAFYQGTAPNGTFLGKMTTQTDLLPGGSETLKYPIDKAPSSGTAYYAIVDDDGKGASAILECVETNNEGDITNVACSVPK